MNGEKVLRVLHADDDESFRLLVERVAASEPRLVNRCRIRFATDGADVVDIVLGRKDHGDRIAHPLPHLILLDQRMVTMDGVETIRILKADRIGKRIPVVLFTTSSQDSLIEACYTMGATFCVRKPLEFERLAPMLASIVEFAVDVLELTEHT